MKAQREYRNTSLYTLLSLQRLLPGLYHHPKLHDYLIPLIAEIPYIHVNSPIQSNRHVIMNSQKYHIIDLLFSAKIMLIIIMIDTGSMFFLSRVVHCERLKISEMYATVPLIYPNDNHLKRQF